MPHGAVLFTLSGRKAPSPEENVPPSPFRIYQPTAAPGCRAPHLWLDSDTSTIDLFGHDLVLLTAQPGAAWRDAAAAASRALGIPVNSHIITNPEWPSRYGITPAGAVLIRPDGHVAWRSRTTPRPSELTPHDRVLAAMKTSTAI